MFKQSLKQLLTSSLDLAEQPSIGYSIKMLVKIIKI